MKKIIMGVEYALLIIAIIVEAVIVAVLYKKIESLEKKELLEEVKIDIVEETEEEIVAQEEQYRVVVNRLPVFDDGDVAANAAKDAITELKRGDTVSVLSEGNSYTRVELQDGTVGYIWFDCIEKLTDDAFQKKNNKVIVIDAGHQGVQNTEMEPIGPGETETKHKVSSGTQGVSSGQPENQLNLTISLKVEKLLEEQGYTAVMIRKTADVNISNMERAMVANQIEADAFIRIHADGSESPSANGSMTIISTSTSKYEVVNYYEESRRLAKAVLDAYTKETGIAANRIMESDDYSGINWCTVPVTIVEMGYMTNEEEDKKMQDPDMQDKMAAGIAKGVIDYLEHSYVE